MISTWLRACLLVGLALLSASPASAQSRDAAAAMGTLPVVDGRRIALIIGNTNYSNGWRRLPNAVNDARHIRDLLSDRSRGSARFEVTLLENATRDQIREALSRFHEQAVSADIAVVYFAGHGFSLDADNFIVPVGAPAAAHQDQVDDLYINMSDVIDAATSRAFSLFFLDACRSPNETVEVAGPRGSNPAAMFGAIDVPNTAVLYSTRYGSNAYDAAPEDARLSPFATAVGEAISIRGLDVPYVFSSVALSVQQATSRMRPVQLPQAGTGYFARFYFIPAVEPSSVPSPRPTTARLNIPLARLATVDEPVIVTEVLRAHPPEELIAMADGGDPLALYLVGYMYWFGVGLPQDLPAARRWLERAGATGHPAGQLELAAFLRINGNRMEDRAGSLELYRAASAQNYAKAQSHLAAELMLETYGPPNRDEALRLYRAAAAQGHPFAIQALAILDDERAERLRTLGAIAAAGNADGDNWLCDLGTRPEFSIDRVGQHCLIAAEQGYVDARAHLALLYRTGGALPQSDDYSRYWARLALASANLRADLRAQLTQLPR